MTITEIIKSESFALAFRQQVEAFAQVSSLPISGLIFEERVDRALKQIGIKTDWSPVANSHKPGADILGLSLKTNKSTKNGFTSMTSYRTASFNSYELKRNFITQEDAKLSGYLFLSRAHDSISLYLITKEEKSFLNLDDYTVTEKDGNFFGVHPEGFRFEIRKTTSGQLMFQRIPLTTIQKHLILKF